MHIKVNPFSNKFKILYKKARYKVLYGGRSSGKSWAIAEALVTYAYNHSIRILCAREIQKSIEKSSYQLVWDTICRMGLDDYFTKINSEIRCTITGSTMYFMGVKSDPAGIKGMEAIDICWVEEAEKISYESIKAIRPTPRKAGSEIWFSFNPRLPSDYVSQLFLSGRLPRRTLIEKINYDENPHCTKETLDEIEDCKEMDDAEYRHIWLGYFMEEGDNLFIPLRIVTDAEKRRPTRMEVPIIAGLDVARYGKDRSALVIRQGNRLLHVCVFPRQSLRKLQEKAITKVMQFKVDVLVVDGNGIGAKLAEDLEAELGSIKVIDHIGGASPKKTKYLNARAEAWGNMKEWLEDEGVIPFDIELQGQLTTIQYKVTNKNQIQLESKEDMAKRGVKSPDIGDALAQTFAGSAKVLVDPNKIKNKMYKDAA